MKEKLLRKPVLIAAGAVVLVAVIVGGIALAGGFRGTEPEASVVVPEPAVPASTVPQAEQTDSSDSNSSQTEAVTAESLLREIGGNLSKTAYVSGNTAFELLAPTGAESKPGANTISYMFESTRSASVVHTSGTVNKDGASIGVESYIVGKDGGKARLLSCRDGVWQAQDDAQDTLTVRNMDELLGLTNLPNYTLEPEGKDADGKPVYVLTTKLSGKSLIDFFVSAGIAAEFPDSALPEDLVASASLTVDAGTKMPMTFTVEAPAGKDTAGFRYTMLFSSFDNTKTISVPEEDINKVIQLAAEKAEEEKRTAPNVDDLSGYHTNVWVDVDLTNQTVTLYADGQVVMTSPCVTGNITNGTVTPTGTYSVAYKDTSAYLMGDAYVDYWMPFNGGIGFHDASWRYGNFAPTEAWGNGSHGCVNMPHDAAQTLYQYLSAGDTVVVHGWPQNPASSHVHNAGDWETVKEATCKEEGKRVRKCRDCGEIVEEGVIAKTDKHTDGKWVVLKEATEDAEGKRELHCAVCDKVIKTEAIAKLAHVHKANGKWEITKEATCGENGERIQRCVKDNTIVITEAIPATGSHNWGDWKETAATCTTDGTRTRTCSVCGKTETETTQAAAGHSWGDWTETPATCTEDGHRSHTCSVCGETETETIPATGHSWGDWTETPATCTEDGQRSRTCSVCGETETETISATGHSDGDGDGLCDVCGASLSAGSGQEP
ncbi:MAG: L,D-transpeptidase [Oscillospiraceae bacterium]|nr:L,D-transpeptidase [Oscillospiraceae bacterium]